MIIPREHATVGDESGRTAVGDARGRSIVGDAIALVAAALVFLEALRRPWPSGVGLDHSWEIGLTEAHLRGLHVGTDIVFTYGPLGYLIAGPANAQTYGPALAFIAAMAICCAGVTAWALAEPIPILQKAVFALVLVIAFAANEDLLFSATIVAWTLAVFRGKKAAPWAALALGIFSGIISLTKFEFALAAAAGGSVLFGGRAWIAWWDENERRAGRRPADTLAPFLETQAHIAAFFNFLAGFLGAYGLVFARLDYGTPVAAGLAAVTVFSATLPLLFPSAGHRLSSALARASSLVSRSAGQPLLSALALVSSLVIALSPSSRAFTLNALRISSGYSSAMSTDGPRLLVVLALCCIVLVGLLIVANLRALTIPVAIALAVAIFVGFKEGFVREDGHVVHFFLVAFLVAGAAVRLSAGRFVAIGIGCVFLLLFAFDVVAEGAGVGHLAVLPLLPVTISDEVAAVGSAFAAQPSDVAAAFAANLAPDRLSDGVRSEVGTQSAEALPLETSAVFANDFNWEPEPVFQTYQVDTRSLDALNAAHLEQHGAGRILYSWYPFDGRYPLWDEPATLTVLLCRYRVDSAVASPVYTQVGAPMLLLSRASSRCGEPVVVAEQHYSWGQLIPVQHVGNGLTFAKISIDYSILGRLAKVFYRIPGIYVRVTGGATYRFVAETAADGVLVDPFPQTLLELQSTLQRTGAPQPIPSFSIDTNVPYLYQPDITVRFETVPFR